MGAYLSEPVKEKNSCDDENCRLRYGVSSMQGWRISQEDAHNCEIQFDNNTSLFAVYDGHGGHEVALYCSQKLPDFIKSTEAYKEGDYKKALIDAFLGFDSKIATKEVIDALKEIAGIKNKSEDDSGEEENVSNLYEEALMPIEQVIEKYQSSILKSNLKKNEVHNATSTNKGKNSLGESSGVASCSSSSVLDVSPKIKTETDESTSDNNIQKIDKNEPNVMQPANSCSELVVNGSNIDKSNNVEIKELNKTEQNAVNIQINSTDSKDSKIESETKVNLTETNEASLVSNGKSLVCKNDDQDNGNITSTKGKGKAVTKTNSKVDSNTNSMNLRVRNTALLYNNLLQMEEESESEDEDDTTFEDGHVNSSSDDTDNDSSEAADDEDSDDDEDDEDLYVDNEFTKSMKEEPGSDSGCTAVVALLHANQLYVANAGDSRCVVCRNGKAVEMSFDHKPEDKPEMDRILNAGGKVTQDGRVNGGLNLSRAIGDHAYKQNKNLTDREQMITALPDIKSLTINPTEDEFMILACDGIWNFMSSQEVVDFIKSRITKENPMKLSQICEELFDHCLAPHTMGDGTGCDNMTAIIVQFKNSLLKRQNSSNNLIEDKEQENCPKRIKTDEVEK